jgi:hypothetical protein
MQPWRKPKYNDIHGKMRGFSFTSNMFCSNQGSELTSMSLKMGDWHGRRNSNGWRDHEFRIWRYSEKNGTPQKILKNSDTDAEFIVSRESCPTPKNTANLWNEQNKENAQSGTK